MHQWLFPIKRFSFVDGDTLDVTVDVGLYIRSDIRVRVSNVDCPEIRRLKSRSAGEASKRAAELWMYRNGLSNKVVWSKQLQKDSFGRVIGDIVFRDNHHNSLSNYLIDSGFGRVYNGGPKEIWTYEELEEIEERAHGWFGGSFHEGVLFGEKSEWEDGIL